MHVVFLCACLAYISTGLDMLINVAQNLKDFLQADSADNVLSQRETCLNGCKCLNEKKMAARILSPLLFCFLSFQIDYGIIQYT